MTPLHVFHRSIAAAVQRIDSGNLGLLGRILFPTELLSSIADISEGDSMTFMSMVKHAAITKTDDRRGFDLTEASSGNSRVHLCNTCDIARLKPAVSFMTHRSPVDFLHSYEKGDIVLDVFTAECYKDTTSGTRTSWVLPWQNQFSGFSRPSCITGPFNTVAHLTSTSRSDPHHSPTSLRLNTLTTPHLHSTS